MLRRAATLLLAVNLCAAQPYQAPTNIVIASSSECPSAEQVSEVLAPLLPSSSVGTAHVAPSDGLARVEIQDSGAAFSVRVAGQARTFDDAARSCPERARLAAVFAGLVLAPPLQPEKREPAPEPTPIPAAIRKPARRDQVSVSKLELGLVLQAAPGAATKELPLAGGFSARFVHGHTLGLSLGTALFLPTTLRFELADARVVRVPFDVSLRVSSRPSVLGASAELGAFIGLLLASGERVTNQQTELRPELGARGALAGSLELGPTLASSLSVELSFVPRPHEFHVRPSEQAGAMPAWWVGGGLAIALRL